MATEAQVRSFIEKMVPIAMFQAAKHAGKIFPSVCIAQACCESAYGTSPKMIKANAVFGIKVGGSKVHFGNAWKDKAYSTKTKECYDGKTYTEITDMFRAYDSIEDSVEDYFDLLCKSSRYKDALNRSSPKECIEGIQKAPFATSPTYVQTIMGIITKYGLTKYDGGCCGQDTKPKTGNPYAEPVASIKKGMRGNGVRWVQFQLNSKGGYKLIVDGIFGDKTLDAVLDFQRKVFSDEKEWDGIVGPKTRAKLTE